jgi:hypothetical protein
MEEGNDHAQRRRSLRKHAAVAPLLSVGMSSDLSSLSVAHVQSVGMAVGIMAVRRMGAMLGGAKGGGGGSVLATGAALALAPSKREDG